VIDREFEVGDSPTIRVGIRSGGVEFEPGEPGRVRIVADPHPTGFTLEQRGDLISAHTPQGGRCYLRASIPPGSNVDVSTASADVRVRLPVNKLDAALASGEIAFVSAIRIDVRTASGDIRGESVEDEARCVTASGDIRLAGLSGRASLSTASGDIVIEDCTGDVSLNTVSGDVFVGRSEGPWIKMKTLSGSIRLGIPSRTRVDLDANSLSGRIRIANPPTERQEPLREMNVKMRSVSGNLRIDSVD
jgi:DUF4097 and DUF4098 domain-containing protein YvlB